MQSSVQIRLRWSEKFFRGSFNNIVGLYTINKSINRSTNQSINQKSLYRNRKCKPLCNHSTGKFHLIYFSLPIFIGGMTNYDVMIVKACVVFWLHHQCFSIICWGKTCFFAERIFSENYHIVRLQRVPKMNRHSSKRVIMPFLLEILRENS